MESTHAMPVCTSKQGKWLTHTQAREVAHTHTHLLQEVGLLRSTGQGLDIGVKLAHLLQGSLPPLAVKGGNRHLPTAGGGKTEGGVNLGRGCSSHYATEERKPRPSPHLATALSLDVPLGQVLYIGRDLQPDM